MNALNDLSSLYALKRRWIKPHLKRFASARLWLCEGLGFSGMGLTPRDAFRMWQSNSAIARQAEQRLPHGTPWPHRLAGTSRLAVTGPMQQLWN